MNFFPLNFKSSILLINEVVPFPYDNSFCAAAFMIESIHFDNHLVLVLDLMQIGQKGGNDVNSFYRLGKHGVLEGRRSPSSLKHKIPHPSSPHFWIPKLLSPHLTIPSPAVFLVYVCVFVFVFVFVCVLVGIHPLKEINLLPPLTLKCQITYIF